MNGLAGILCSLGYPLSSLPGVVNLWQSRYNLADFEYRSGRPIFIFVSFVPFVVQ